MKRLILLIFISVNVNLSFAQVKSENNINLIEDLLENSAEQINESSQTELPEELNDLIRHPIDLNSEETEKLVDCNLLNRTQKDELTNYIRKMGKLIEPEELQQVAGFDKKTILSILPYSVIYNQKKEAEMHMLTMRFQKPLNNREDYYSGSDTKMLIRYRGSAFSNIKLACTFEKDEGEEILTRDKQGFDFNSANISYKGNRMIRKIIAGDYNVEFGQGLTAWSGMSFGIGSSITGIFKNGRRLIPYSGTDENRFFRGIAISLAGSKFQTDAWLSYHGIDGNLVTDSVTKEEYVTSLQTSGYHRSYGESTNYHSQKESAAGINFSYSDKGINAGFVAEVVGYKYSIKNNPQPYNKFYFSGKENINNGIYYSYSYRNLIFFGEASYNYGHSTAFINGIIMSIDPKLSLGILWRCYPANYTNLKSNSFGVNSNNNNETGTYLGINYRLSRMLSLSSYIDIYSFTYLKYRVDKPSQGNDILNQIDFIPTKKFNAQFRYRSKLKEQNTGNDSDGKHKISELSYNSFRLSFRFKIDNTWEYGFRTEYLIQKTGNIKTGSGEMISQDLFFHPMGKRFSANFRYAIFNCPQFESRIYEYENDIQGAFSIPFYYGTGSRFYFNMNYKPGRRFTISARYSISWIDEGTSTGKSDLKLQLKTVF